MQNISTILGNNQQRARIARDSRRWAHVVEAGHGRSRTWNIMSARSSNVAHKVTDSHRQMRNATTYMGGMSDKRTTADGRQRTWPGTQGHDVACKCNQGRARNTNRPPQTETTIAATADSQRRLAKPRATAHGCKTFTGCTCKRACARTCRRGSGRLRAAL